MKKNLLFLFATVLSAALFAQTPIQRVYTILNTKCQNSTCHSASSAEALKFDGTSDQVWSSIYNRNSENASSVTRYEKLIKPGHPYSSFLLKKIAGATFDTDLSLDATDGALMLDINGDTLSKKEIEFVRQWIMCGAKKAYSGSEIAPSWQIISDYYDNPVNPFLPKPMKPAAGTGIQLRMGPVLVGTGSSETEREYLLQQEVNFPYLAEINKIDGFMNQQSHHFLLFRFQDSTAANARAYQMERVSLTGGTTSFDGDKDLTSSWQDDAEFNLPTGTALFWPKKTFLDMNYHVKNYNATAVLPCDFYFNVYFQPRTASTIEMKSALVNNATLFLPQGVQTRDYDDPANNQSTVETRYLWALASHAHKYGTDYDLFVRDSTGQIGEQIYEGFYDYALDYDKGFYDWEHPSLRYWNNFKPIKFGRQNGNKSGIVARTTWNVQQSFVTFGFTTSDEMQLFYYMYTSQNPFAITGVETVADDAINFTVYPNPMNNTGSLIYTLNEDLNIKATITDVTGKVVASLTEELQSKGTHTVSIGENNSLAKGIYFANVTVNGKTSTKKFIVTE
jgi:hypothetical protein